MGMVTTEDSHHQRSTWLKLCLVLLGGFLKKMFLEDG